MDFSSVIPYDTPDTNGEPWEKVQDRGWLLNVRDAAFPPDHVAWLAAYERSVDTPVKQTYHRGILQPQFDPSAPTIRIGIIFLEGANKPAVAMAELKRAGMNEEAGKEPTQKSPEWRVATAATLLRRFEMDEDLKILRQDDSLRIIKANKIMGSQRKRLSISDQGELPLPQISNSFRHAYLTIGSSRPLRRRPTGDHIQALIKRDIQDHLLNINSEYIEIIHKDPVVASSYDIISTLIEVDMQSIISLLANFRNVISSNGDVSSKKITKILHTMINDARRLCTRSPTLFRLATRVTIARSRDTRYGVDYGSVFATMTTSEGIRILIERSVSYFVSLDENIPDQALVKPRFLQMLVMLVALLNNYDLKMIGGCLEDTFKIPGDREGLELLILKVLPLESVNSRAFMEDLHDDYYEGRGRIDLKDPKQQKEQWRKLQQDLAEKGFILPVVFQPVIQEDGYQDDLMSLMEQQELEDENEGAAALPNGGPSSDHQRSWSAPWPEDKGLRYTTIFRHIQHCGKLQEEGNYQKETVKAVNNVPYLNLTSEDKDNQCVIFLHNGDKFRARCEDADDISLMKKDRYTLNELETDSIVDLNIETTTLNAPFIEATKEHNFLVEAVNDFLGSQQRERSFLSTKKPKIGSFTRLEDTSEALRVWAELTPQSCQPRICAEAFKLGERILDREDILRNMNDVLSRLSASITRIENAIPEYRAKYQERDMERLQESNIKRLRAKIEILKRLQKEAADKREELYQTVNVGVPSDPIVQVIYANFIPEEQPEWQPYVSRLHPDRERLIVQTRILVIDKVVMDNAIKLYFRKYKLIVIVQPLTSQSLISPVTLKVPSFSIKKGNIVLWLGYYVVLVEPQRGVKNSYVVLAYYRVITQKQERASRELRWAGEKPKGLYLV